MTYDEALTVTGMVLTTWPSSKEWGEDEMSAYANGLMRYDASICVAAVAAAQQKLMYRPSVAELREFYDLERAKTRARTEKPVEQVAKLLARFGQSQLASDDVQLHFLIFGLHRASPPLCITRQQ